MRKLLIVGSNTVHVYSYIDLVKSYFDDILLITDKKRANTVVNSIEFDFHFKIKNYTATVSGIKKVISDYNPTVIHVHQANSYAFFTFLAAKKNHVPKVLTAWGSDILINPQKKFILKQIVKYNLKNADALTSDSQYMALEMQNLVKEKKLDITVANFGIDVPKNSLPKENIIYTNRLHKKLYRIDKIIEAFKLFSASNESQNWKLIIAATGDETDALKNQVANLGLSGKVKFIGWVDKTQNSEWYSKSKFFVSIPESDATSISLLEAMSHGCLPIVSDLPANNEWVTNNKNGIIVNDVASDFISDALALDTNAAAQINWKIINENATKEINRAKFISVYEKLIG